MDAPKRPNLEATERALFDLYDNLHSAASAAEQARLDRLLARMVEAPDNDEVPTLRAWLRARPRSRREILALFADAGGQLQAAHDEGRTHGFALDSVHVDAAGLALLPKPSPGSASDDQLCFCAALWEALHGAPPFSSARPHPHGSPQVPDGVWIPSWIRAALERGLSSDPGRRFPDMQALLRAMSSP